MKRYFIILVLFFGFLFILNNISSARGKSKKVRYPRGYRSWVHVKSMIIQKGHPLFPAFGGIHHIYANKKAIKAMMKGTRFEDGSVIVFDLLEAEVKNNAILEGKRRFIGVMRKDASIYKETGGWGFEAFKDDTKERMVKDPKEECFKCHLSQKDKDYVFSSYRK